jgi:hypothetical protein
MFEHEEAKANLPLFYDPLEPVAVVEPLKTNKPHRTFAKAKMNTRGAVNRPARHEQVVKDLAQLRIQKER